MTPDDKNRIEEDDGRTIADMSGVGASGGFLSLLKKGKKADADPGAAAQTPQPAMSKEERRAYVLASIGATLLIGLIYLSVFAAVIWLMQKFWS